MTSQWTTPQAGESEHAPYLREALKLAREALDAGSAPVGAVMVDQHGQILARGRNRVNDRQDSQHIGQASLAHAEMDLYFQLGRLHQPETLTLYTSLEPCLMCGGASALLGVGRIVWATDDPWGGSGRLIAWSDHPAMQHTQIVAHPDATLETEGARLFAHEACRVFPAEGWKLWRQRYPQETAGLEQTSAL